MSEYLTLSSRGQITLPAKLRSELGLEGGDTLVLENRRGQTVLKPQVVFDVYEDDQIEQWNAEDELEDRDRERILRALGNP